MQYVALYEGSMYESTFVRKYFRKYEGTFDGTSWSSISFRARVHVIWKCSTRTENFRKQR